MTTVTEAGTAPAPTLDRNGRAALAIHLATIPFGLAGSVVVWLIARKRSLWIRQQALQSLNYRLNITILGIITTLTEIVLRPILEDPNAVRLPQPPGIVFKAIEIGLVIYAAVRAYNGAWMPYPRLFNVIKPLPEPASA